MTPESLAETDETLCRRAREGCRTSFAALITRHYDRIYRMAWRWCGSRNAAEDITQDVCIKLATAVRGYRGDAAFTTWLHRIAYTTTLDHLRANQRMLPAEPSEIVRLMDQTCLAEDPEADAHDDTLWQAVRALSPQQRDAVLLIYGEEMTHAEAAVVMGCREKTVSWHLHEAKKALRIKLEAVG